MSIDAHHPRPGSLSDFEFYTLRRDDGSQAGTKGWRGDRGSINMVTSAPL